MPKLVLSNDNVSQFEGLKFGFLEYPMHIWRTFHSVVAGKLSVPKNKRERRVQDLMLSLLKESEVIEEKDGKYRALFEHLEMSPCFMSMEEKKEYHKKMVMTAQKSVFDNDNLRYRAGSGAHGRVKADKLIEVMDKIKLLVKELRDEVTDPDGVPFHAEFISYVMNEENKNESN